MRKIISDNYPWALATILVILSHSIFCQASNDLCDIATDLGVLTEYQCPSIIETGMIESTAVYGSTIDAQTEFPFPVNPFNCSGYSNSLSPSDDLWYVFDAECTFELSVGPNWLQPTTDSIRISLWHGFECSSLSPIACHLAIPNEQYSIEFADVFAGRYFVQIQNPSSNNSSEYSFCARALSPACVNVQVNPSDSTHVQCFPYSMNIEYSSILGPPFANAHLELEDLFSPYQILWSNGAVNQESNFGLAAGNYSVLVTDNTNCSNTILFSVDSLITGIVPEATTPFTFHISSDRELKVIGKEGVEYSIKLLDTSGSSVFQSDTNIGLYKTSLIGLSKGVYILILKTSTGHLWPNKISL